MITTRCLWWVVAIEQCSISGSVRHVSVYSPSTATLWSSQAPNGSTLVRNWHIRTWRENWLTRTSSIGTKLGVEENDSACHRLLYQAHSWFIHWANWSLYYLAVSVSEQCRNYFLNVLIFPRSNCPRSFGQLQAQELQNYVSQIADFPIEMVRSKKKMYLHARPTICNFTDCRCRFANIWP